MLAFHFQRVRLIDNSGFQAAERKVILAFRLNLRKFVCGIIARFRKLVKQRAARIRNFKNARDLVKRFPGGVVRGFSDHGIRTVFVHADDMAVSAGCNQADKGRFKLRMRNKVCAHMAFDVIYAHKRLIKRIGKRLGPAYARKKRAYKTRAIGYGNRVNVVKGHIRFFKRAVQKRIQRLHMHAAGNFRYNAAVQRMRVHLRCNLTGQHFASVSDNRNRSFIAR